MKLYAEKGTQYHQRRNPAPESMRYRQQFETNDSKRAFLKFLDDNGITDSLAALGYKIHTCHGWLYTVSKEGLDACQDTKDKLIVLGKHADGWIIEEAAPEQYRLTYHLENTRYASSTDFTCALPNKHRSSATTFSTPAALIEMGSPAAGVKAVIYGLCPRGTQDLVIQHSISFDRDPTTNAWPATETGNGFTYGFLSQCALQKALEDGQIENSPAADNTATVNKAADDKSADFIDYKRMSKVFNFTITENELSQEERADMTDALVALINNFLVDRTASQQLALYETVGEPQALQCENPGCTNPKNDVY